MFAPSAKQDMDYIFIMILENALKHPIFSLILTKPNGSKRMILVVKVLPV
jgi:hypothetical protein